MSDAMIAVQGVSKRFGGVLALSDVTFEIAPRSITGLLGPNGAGKSTLFDVMSGVQRPDSGRVTVRGTDVTAARPHKIARLGLARTFQKVRLLDELSVIDNVIVAALMRARTVGAATAVAEAALEKVGLLDVRARSTTTLPLIDRKRLEIARALAMSPKILMLDEVMCGLNPVEIETAVALLRTLNEEGTTLLVVEHLLDVMLGLCDRIVVLDHGALIADGVPEGIRRDPRVIAAYIGGGDDQDA